MKHQWVAYAIVAVLSIGAGVAIAGLPDSSSVDSTIVAPATTEVPQAPSTTVAPEAVTTESPPETTTTTTPEAPETTVVEETTTTVPEPVLPERSELSVVVANGADVGGIAGSTANGLQDLGYVGVRSTDGEEVVFFSIVYYLDDFEASAVRLATDLGLEITSIGPMADAPGIGGGLDDEALLAYLGADQR